MRPKNTYTKEEYNQLGKKVEHLMMELQQCKQELENSKYLLEILNQSQKCTSLEEVKSIIEDCERKRNLEEKYIKHAYYKEIRDYVDMGITDIKKISNMIGKSRSTVERAINEMGLHKKPKEKDFSNIKLKI